LCLACICSPGEAGESGWKGDGWPEEDWEAGGGELRRCIREMSAILKAGKLKRWRSGQFFGSKRRISSYSVRSVGTGLV
jgi:hypothetical protein